MNSSDSVDKRLVKQKKRVAASNTKRKNKKRLRSRHSYIDDCLREESGDDAYADLEDFIEG